MKALRLSPEREEISSDGSDDEGQGFFRLPGTHPNFLDNPFNSNEYGMSVWILKKDVQVVGT